MLSPRGAPESVARMTGFDSLPAIVRRTIHAAARPIPVATAARMRRRGLSPDEAATRLQEVDRRLCRKDGGE